MTGSIPDPRAEASVEFDQLSLTRKLVLELLAARHRCGEQVWTLEHDRALRPILEDLQHSGWLGYRSGVVERTWLAWLSDKGRSVLLSGDYIPPILAADEASGVRRVTAQELADNAAEAISGISAMISGSYPPSLDAEAHMWRRHQKVSNEAGEVLDAIEGAIGENPRKGVTKTWGDVDKELLDTAVAALGAYEFNHGNDGSSVGALFKHAAFIHERLSAAIAAADSPVGGVS